MSRPVLSLRKPVVVDVPKPAPVNIPALARRLREQYPVLGSFLPLAIGSGRIIKTREELDTPSWCKVMAFHCRSSKYLAACAKAGAVRYHLDGSVAGPVSDEDRAYSQSILDARKVVNRTARQIGCRNG